MGQKVSPGGSVHTSSLISDVARIVKAAQEANRNPEKALITWKQKYGEEVDAPIMKKRKGPRGGGRIVEKGRKLSGNVTNDLGCGTALPTAMTILS